MPDTSRPMVGTTLAERYAVLREIGRGAMGTVYEARHAVIGRRFAIKVLKQSCASATQRERFFHEARAAGAISHPHIVQVQDFGLAPDGAPYIVMEYVDGVSLQQHMESVGQLPFAEAVEICAQVLSALEVIHGAGLVHRDIKPANIMLTRGTTRARIFAKLLDFGIARAINAAWHRPDLTRVDQVLGTPAYLSPEQATGATPDPRWDLWALATILYELLAAKLPFRLESLQQVTDDIVHGRLMPLRERCPDLPRWLLDVVERAHQPQLEARFRSATAFLQALEQRNPRPEGDEGVDARTVPFVRVDLATPPPELLGRLAGDGRASGAAGDESAPVDGQGSGLAAVAKLLRASARGEASKAAKLSRGGSGVGAGGLAAARDSDTEGRSEGAPSGGEQHSWEGEVTTPEQSRASVGAATWPPPPSGANPLGPVLGAATRLVAPPIHPPAPAPDASEELDFPAVSADQIERAAENQLTIPVSRLSSAEMRLDSAPLPSARETARLEAAATRRTWLLLAAAALLLLSLATLLFLLGRG